MERKGRWNSPLIAKVGLGGIRMLKVGYVIFRAQWKIKILNK